MRKKFSPKQQRLLVAGCAVALVAAVAGIYVFRVAKKTTTVVPKGPEAPQVTSSNTSKGSGDSGASNTGNGSTSQPAVPTDQSRVNSSLSAPSGQLAGTMAPPAGSTAAVSMAQPNVNANCRTLQGANCVAVLTSPTGVSKTINSTSNDGQGNFVFDWSAAGYETGTWQVKLVATKNDQQASANIGPLTVNP